ncbi:hypothetical protein HPB50_023312 [Hyalomma asiaticum]|uniref:Uncharacterized protein n=1 Tax=Hyalomma asiaticum TaxID=266040 RepID=A0ACB7TQ60_HYAAI|nr:hypothetical protein HPB50_023312 [Hyalomma asiaticum]
MEAAVLFEMKKKNRSPAMKNFPFPLVFEQGTDKPGLATLHIFRGVLKPDGVEVTSQEDMNTLYHMGYFGKGTLSRSAPRFNTDFNVEDPIEERAVSFHRYQRHKQLQEKAEVEGILESNPNLDSPKVTLVNLPGNDTESCSDVAIISETGFCRPVPRILAGRKNLNQSDRGDGDGTNPDDCVHAEYSEGGSEEWMNIEGSENGDNSSDIIYITDESSDQEAAYEEAGSAETSDNCPDIFQSDSSGEQITKGGKDYGQLPLLEPQNVDDSSSDIIEVDSQTGAEVMGEDKSAVVEESLQVKDYDEKADANQEMSTLAPERHGSVTDRGAERMLITDQEDAGEEQPLEIELSAPQMGWEENSANRATPDETSSGSAEEVSQCEQESHRADEEGGIISSDSDEVELAYFLSYGLGCLIVNDGGEDLDLLKLWQRLCELHDNFPVRYAAYHHFRCRGWVVRSGARFGTDYPGFSQLCIKARAKVGHYKKSSKARACLLEVQREMQLDVLERVQDVPTHWNSEHQMMTRLLKLRRAELSECDGIDNLTVAEWKLMSAAVKVLDPLAQATTELSGDMYPTLSQVILLLECTGILFLGMRFNLDDSLAVAVSLVHSIKARFPGIKTSEETALAMLLDLRFKDACYTERAEKKWACAILTKAAEGTLPFVRSEPSSQSTRLDSPQDTSVWEAFASFASVGADISSPTIKDDVEGYL